MAQPSPDSPHAATGERPAHKMPGGARLARELRTGIIVLAVIGILLGATALLVPDATLVTVALVFGGYLLLTGLARIGFALRARQLGRGVRWTVGAIGGFVAVAGLLLLASPATSLLILAMLLGAGWFLEGLSSIVAGVLDTGFGLRWWTALSGIIGCIAGVTVLILPAAALQAFVIVGGALLVAISVSLLIIAVQRPGTVDHR